MTDSGSARHRVSSLMQVVTVTKYNFLNYFRARRFYVMIIIVALVSGLLTFVIAYRRPPEILGVTDLNFLSTIWGTFVSFIIILSTAFFGGDAISSEFQNRTGYFLVPNPIRRSVIYTGKWIAALIASTIILLIYAGVAIANSFYYFGLILPNEFLQSMLFAWVFLVAALAFTFAFSSLFKSSAIAVLMSVIMLLFVFNVIDTVTASFAGIEPWFSITYGAGIVQSILSVPYPQQVVTQTFGPRGGFSLTTYTAPVWEGLAILGIYFIVMAVVGLWLFERKEFTS